MYNELFADFLTSGDTLRVYRDGGLVFSSAKDRLRPLLDYLRQSSLVPKVVLFDKVMGNAAALLSVKAGCAEVYSPLGSQTAVSTLERYAVSHHLTEVIPYIQGPQGNNICPMEKLSQGRTPEEFYRLIAGPDLTPKT
jgi:hypothetical protein